MFRQLVAIRTPELQLLKDILTLQHIADDPADDDDGTSTSTSTSTVGPEGDEEADPGTVGADLFESRFSHPDQEETQVPTNFAAEDSFGAELPSPKREKVRPPVPMF